MAGINQLNQIRQAFQIPDSVLIITDRELLPPRFVTKQNTPDFTIDNTDSRDQPIKDYQSLLDTPVYTNIEFLPGSYETNTKNVFKSFGSVNGPERLRYEAVLITVSQAKKIIKTEIQGRDGTVKEYIGLDDYTVTVNGIITGANGVRPLDQIAALKKMCDAPIPVKVASKYLQLLGIDSLVLDSYEFNETEGSYSYQQFSLSFLSDTPQELELTNL